MKYAVMMIAAAVLMTGVTVRADLVNDGNNDEVKKICTKIPIYKVLDNAKLTCGIPSTTYLKLECPDIDCTDPQTGLPYVLDSAKVCILADGVDANDTVRFMRPVDGSYETIGTLEQIPDCKYIAPKPGPGSWCDKFLTKTCFELEPEWLEDGCFKLKVDGCHWLIPSSVVEIEKACLICEYVPIPAPGAAVLGSLGLGMIGWLRRRIGR